MRNVEGRSVVQALVVFLLKTRTGDSNSMVSGIFGMTRPQAVSGILNSIIKSFGKDVLPFRFGFSARSRTDLIQNETSEFARELFGTGDNLALIYDLRHGKSANSSYQRKSFSGQKKTPLVKPFTICTMTGYVAQWASGSKKSASLSIAFNTENRQLPPISR